MIKSTKLESFNNCNCCGKYNMQPIHSIIEDEIITHKDIYEYFIGCNNGGMLIRLCDDCAKDMITKLCEQIRD